MAFEISRFGSDSSNVKSILGGVNYYRYFNKDNNTLTTPGYFPSDLGLEVGDRIHVVPATKTDPDEVYVVSTIVNGVITMKQIDTDGAVDSVNGKTGNVVLGANDVLPTQTDNAGKFLKTDGTDVSWENTSLAATVTLVVADWSANTQTVDVTGVTATNSVIVSPAPASQSDYTTAGILCTAQGAGTLTFTCTATPTNAIDVNVLILN